MEVLKSIFKSTNGTLSAIFLLITGVALLFNFPGNELVGIISAVIAFVGLARKWLKEGVKFKFDGNAITYIIAGLVGLFPSLAKLFEAGGDIIEAITTGNLTLILGAVIVFINMLIQQLKKKPPLPAT